ncbi:CAP domain-containing protein [Salinibacillus xinjiangensis]|uniref:SCP-like extracellular protein n=1 Tax=Salinibacillus xinjiangensis TaxID=1229268 RepID=A0A6G1X789_9BACI|nr:CAP domain-containing protein [Salinibacillus xinjiangensis]MRG86871.1 SCP-like extracellular protein [Salinibacillus xinjiangensis]
MMKKRLLVSVISLLLLILAACNTEEGAREQQNQDDNISSINTSENSKSYPHTQPIKIQDAKYKFIRVEREQQHRQQQQTDMQQNWQAPQQNQQQQQQIQQQQDQNQQAQQQQQQQNQQQDQNQTNQQQEQANQTQGLSEFESKVVELTNAERSKEGLPKLKADTSLSNVARKKSQDMQAKGYFSHTSPTYGSPFDMMRDFGIDYQSAAENIAKGQRTPEEVVNSWMNSSGHRKNIMNSEFTHIGVGLEKNGYYWTQMFIKK